MNKAVTIIAKIAEVGNWVGCGMMIAITIGLITGSNTLMYALSSIDESTSDLEVCGFSINTMVDGQVAQGTFMIFFITGIITCALMAMVFRNVYLIFKTSMGKTKFSEGETPFQKANVRMIREIGIFCIAIPAIEFIMTIIAHIAFGNVECSFSYSGILFGLVVLCLSRFFSYGMELQKDTEGLV